MKPSREVFRDVHEKVELSEIQTRSTISKEGSSQGGLWSQEKESELQQRATGVGSAAQRQASRAVVPAALSNGPMRFDLLAALVMEARAMRLTHTKDLLNEMRREGLVSFELPGRAKKPQPDTLITAA